MSTDRDHALRLLRVLYERHLGERDQDAALAMTISPEMQDAEAAGVGYATTSYNQAIRWLLDEGALVPDEALNAMYANVVDAPEHGWGFKITPTGLELLRRDA
jgi:hypothetical protein